MFVAGVGRNYDVAPGETMPLKVVLAAAHPDDLPVGSFGLTASVWYLDLESDTGLLEITDEH